MFAVIPRVLPVIATPERLRGGLEFVARYFHANGVTLGCEPGGLYSRQLQDAQNAVLSGAQSPLRFYFIPDGKSLYATFPDIKAAPALLLRANVERAPVADLAPQQVRRAELGREPDGEGDREEEREERGDPGEEGAGHARASDRWTAPGVRGGGRPARDVRRGRTRGRRGGLRRRVPTRRARRSRPGRAA